MIGSAAQWPLTSVTDTHSIMISNRPPAHSAFGYAQNNFPLRVAALTQLLRFARLAQRKDGLDMNYHLAADNHVGNHGQFIIAPEVAYQKNAADTPTTRCFRRWRLDNGD